MKTVVKPVKTVAFLFVDKYMKILPGQFILTRNLNESDNTSPGYWNHCAICVPDGIIEAQQDKGVILSNVNEFIKRYPEMIVLQMTSDKIMLKKMIDRAYSLLDNRYRGIASVFKYLRRDYRGENCVSLVRKCYLAGTNIDPDWLKPDDLLKHGKIVERKNNANSSKGTN